MIVFDSSALLAYLLGEPGGSQVESRLEAGGAVSAASWSEVAQKLAAHGGWSAGREILLSFPVTVETVDRADAESAAALWRPGSGLSLADRLCLALGDRLEAEILTADRAWADYPRVTLIR